MHERHILQDEGAARPHHNHGHGVPSSDALRQHQLVALAIVHQILGGCRRISQQPGLGRQPGIPVRLVGLCTCPWVWRGPALGNMQRSLQQLGAR